MSLAKAKTYGGIGAIVSLIGIFGFGFPIMGATGLILILIAVKQISDELEEKRIFDKYLVSFILGLIVIIGLMVSLYESFLGIENGNTPKVTHSGRWFALLPFAALEIVSKVYLRTSYKIIAKHTNIDKFRKAGFFHLIGSIFFVAVTGYLISLVVNIHEVMDAGSAPFIALTTLIFLGVFILITANIYEIMAYFSLPEEISGKKKRG